MRCRSSGSTWQRKRRAQRRCGSDNESNLDSDNDRDARRADAGRYVLLHLGPPPSSFPDSLSTYTLAAPVEATLDIRKSRFIGLVLPVEDREAAMRRLQALRDEHPGAAHVCWALLAAGQSGMSDDGEPSGTAGRPIMEVLRHHELDNVFAAVIRYYGGVKLGAGGLVRAYTDAVAMALKEARRIERVALADLAVEVDYADEARVRRWMDQQRYTLTDSRHGELVNLIIRLPLSELGSARAGLQELTNGRCRIEDAKA